MKTNKIIISAMALSFAFFASCSKSEDAAPLPQIGGYNNAGEVGAADLVAYWPMNGTGVESKSSTAPTTTVGTTWETGVKGQGAKLTAGFMKYPVISALSSSLTSFSMSAWVKVSNNQTPTSGSPSVFLTLARAGEWAGNINFSAETGQQLVASDSLVVKGQIVSNNSLGWQTHNNALHLEPWMVSDNLVTPGKHVAFANKVAGTWAHFVFTWDGTTRMLKVYSNGVKITNPAFEQRGTPDGTLLAFTTPTFPIIGAYATAADGTTTDAWNKAMTGSIDEMRVWKKALSAAEIGSLYEIEKAGR
jgi:hypothetical protein